MALGGAVHDVDGEGEEGGGKKEGATWLGCNLLRNVERVGHRKGRTEEEGRKKKKGARSFSPYLYPSPKIDKKKKKKKKKTKKKKKEGGKKRESFFFHRLSKFLPSALAARGAKIGGGEGKKKGFSLLAFYLSTTLWVLQIKDEGEKGGFGFYNIAGCRKREGRKEEKGLSISQLFFAQGRDGGGGGKAY